MKELLLLAIVIMILLVIFQIAKASEYVSVLKGEDKTRKQTNKINGFLLITFLVFGLIGVYVCNEWFFKKTLFPQGSASVEGEKIDFMLYLTIGVTGVIFIITQVLLFWFCFRYQEKEGKKWSCNDYSIIQKEFDTKQEAVAFKDEYFKNDN